MRSEELPTQGKQVRHTFKDQIVAIMTGLLTDHPPCAKLDLHLVRLLIENDALDLVHGYIDSRMSGGACSRNSLTHSLEVA